MVSRRLFLAAGAAGAGAVALAGCDPEPPPADPTVAAPPLDPNDWASIRAQFALSKGVANFTAFVFASHPASVRAAIERHRVGLDADAYAYLHANESTLDEGVATAAATYLRTEATRIAFTDSTTMGLGLLYSGLRLTSGDEVLTTEHDFYATHESWRLRSLRDGVTVRRVRLYDEPEHADAADIVNRLVSALSDRTRVIAVTWVHSSTGVRLPVKAIADAVANVNAGRAPAQRALLCVDGVHGFGIEDAGPEDLGCDFLVSGTHKWLFGPRGTGFIWGRPDAWSRYTPIIPTFTGDPEGPPGAFATPGGYHSFEHRWALAEAFAFHQTIGRARVAERSRTLAARLKDGLAGISSIRLRTPRSPDVSAGIVCCEVPGYTASEAVAKLLPAKVLASATPYSPSYLRFGTSVLANESDVDQAIEAVRAL
jgi:selenocysteine lyase/cysteine desulfurase